MPVLAGQEMTEAAIGDCLGQSVPTRILIVNQGAEDALRSRLERLAEEYSDRIFLWSHDPHLPSLSGTWNRALDFVWATGGQEALVVNNDVRLHPRTVQVLSTVLVRTDSLFVSAIGVTKEQFDPLAGIDLALTGSDGEPVALDKGGPDFSCFLISKQCHHEYRFDENFIPAFCEDLDYHRRLMLAGEGSRIFSVNLPYLHLASQTLKLVDPKRREAIERSIEQHSRAYYKRKWGGPVNLETYWVPFDKGVPERRISGIEPTTPNLQTYYNRSTNGVSQ